MKAYEKQWKHKQGQSKTGGQTHVRTNLSKQNQFDPLLFLISQHTVLVLTFDFIPSFE
jgi:hypothetical protein